MISTIHSIESFFYSMGLNLVLLKIIILTAALAIILLGIYSKKINSNGQWKKIGDYFLVILGGLSILVYMQFMPFTSQPHYPEMFHYYLGSKYFPEIGYTRLYACVTRAEAESNDDPIRIQAYKRSIRDLKTNEIVPAHLYYFDDTFCKVRFSPSRWENFKTDVEFFRSHMDGSMGNKWNAVLVDHGFNPSPVWTLAGGLISNMQPLSESSLMVIKLIDVIFLAGCITCIIFFFDLPTAAFAVISSTALDAVDWAWYGRSLLRLDWLFMATLSICFMKRGYCILAGAALGYAAALRVFPAVFALGPLTGLIFAIYMQQHELKAVYVKFFGGMAISIIILALFASAIYGFDSFREFINNTKKHSAVVSLNNTGLRTVLTYNPDTAHRKTFDRNSTSPLTKWRQSKIEAKRMVMPVYIAIVIFLLLFFIPAVTSVTTWQSIAIGASFIPFAWSELSNYYYIFIMIISILFFNNRKIAFPLLGIGIVSALSELFSKWLWQDEIYTLFSAAVCIGFLVIWWQVNTQAMPWKKIFTASHKDKNTVA